MIILPIVRVIEFHFWSNFSDSVSIGIVHRIHIFSMKYRLEHRVASFCDYFIAFPIGFGQLLLHIRDCYLTESKTSIDQPKKAKVRRNLGRPIVGGAA